jgi:hypothetical protein
MELGVHSTALILMRTGIGSLEMCNEKAFSGI